MADDGAGGLSARLLASHWPALQAGLGERADAFVEAARARGLRHGLTDEAALARFVNLCCAAGPGFEDKPRYEGVLAILSDQRLTPWVKLHQAILRTAAELQRRASDGGQAGRGLLLSDAALLDLLDQQALARDRQAEPLPRLDCDLEAVDLRLLEIDWRQEYRLQGGSWQRLALPAAPPPVRAGLGRPAPPLLSVLTGSGPHAPAARLQVRCALHAQCAQERHPRIVFGGAQGRWHWAGHEAKARSWPVQHALDPVPATPGLGMRLLAETMPETSLLRVDTCGLREDGVPTGPIELFVWAYPAEQWLFTLQRDGTFAWDWPQAAASGARAAPAPTRLRIERDGIAVPAEGWRAGFDGALEAALQAGADALFVAWQAGAGEAAMQLEAQLLAGDAGLTWGWREGAAGLGGKPVLRVAGALALRNSLTLELVGNLTVGLAQSRVRLRCTGGAAQQAELLRETEAPDLAAALAPATVRWRAGFSIAQDPVAVDSGTVIGEFGAVTGALLGEAGLRPRSQGGGGWEWFLRISLEAVSVPLCVADPVLGRSWRRADLLPAQTLLDWSLG